MSWPRLCVLLLHDLVGWGHWCQRQMKSGPCTFFLPRFVYHGICHLLYAIACACAIKKMQLNENGSSFSI